MNTHTNHHPLFFGYIMVVAIICGTLVFMVSPVHAQLESPKNGGIDGGPLLDDDDDEVTESDDDEDDEVDLSKSKYEPSKMTASAESAFEVRLTWRDNAKDEDGYHVARMDSSGRWTRIAMVNKNVEAFTDRTVASSTRYTYRVRAYNRSSESGYSSQVTVTTPAKPEEVGADELLDAGEISNEEVLDQLQKTDLTAENVDDSVAEKTYECKPGMVPARELEEYVSGECDAMIKEAREEIRAEFGDKLAEVEAQEKIPPLWKQLYYSTTARIIASALLLFIVLNNIYWHMTHRSARK